VNEYAVLQSKRENGYRCFMLTYPKSDVFSLMAINVLLEYVQNKRMGSKGLTILFVGYDERYSKYSHSLRVFLKKLNQGNSS
jgi:hypothetical protein